ncbi:MAG: hypothetical protein LLG42_04275 [Chloroflexi bacterium]|nr:hypothetical protein [Chloroflexota bacterium]
MFINRVSEVALLEKRFASGKAEFLFSMAAGGLAKLSFWRDSARATVRFSLLLTWARKFPSEPLYPRRSIQYYSGQTK